MNVSDRITKLARTRADWPAIIDGARTLSYAELDRLIEETAAGLAALGIGPGDRIGVCLRERAEHLIALFAAARLWAMVAPMDWRAPVRERQRVAEAFALDLVITEPETEAGAITGAIAWDALAERGRSAGRFAPPPAPEADPLFLIAPSSGSTGAPKGLVVSHANELARIVRLKARLHGEDNIRYLLATPLVHASGRNKCMATLTSGGTVVLFPTLYDPEELVAAATRHRISTLYIVPTIARRLLALDGAPLFPTVNHLQIGSGVLTAEERAAALTKLSPNVYVTYGASGYSTIATLAPDELLREPESVGRAAYRTEIEIVDDDDRPLPVGADGRLRCRGPGLASAIIGQASAGWEALRAGWYYPGDLARIDAAGYLHLVGRVANIIRRGGTTVIAEEVERVVALHPAIAEVAVAARPSATHGDEIVAYVVARESVTPASLAGHCRRHLAPTKVPSEFVFVDAMPRNAAGKIVRRVLGAAAPARAAVSARGGGASR